MRFDAVEEQHADYTRKEEATYRARQLYANEQHSNAEYIGWTKSLEGLVWQKGNEGFKPNTEHNRAQKFAPCLIEGVTSRHNVRENDREDRIVLVGGSHGTENTRPKSVAKITMLATFPT